MIGKLAGLVDETGDGWVILDVAGVGYLVQASARTLSRLPGVGERAVLYIETHVREDHIHLFGFPTRDELAMFHLLQTVQGVGAKVALAIQSVLSPENLALAVAAGDKAAVSEAPGVGPKLAARLINELKDKVGEISGLGAGLKVVANGEGDKGGDFRDAVSALVNLGYRPTDAHGAVAAAQAATEGQARVEDLIRQGLRELSA